MINRDGFVQVSGLRALGVPFAASTVWEKVRNGEFPTPYKLSSKCTAWRIGDVIDWQQGHAQETAKTDNVAGKKLTSIRNGKRHVDHAMEAAKEEARSDVARSLCPSLATHDQLLALRRKAVLEPGIYVLFHGDEVVYVGQSKNPQARIGQHAASPVKTFDSFVFIPCAEEHLDREEVAMIRRFRPKLNTAGNRD